MALSGCFLVLFLLFHMSMNLVSIISMEAYEQICAFLGISWYALLGTLIIALGVVVHILYATILTLKNRKARGGDKYATTNLSPTEWSSKNMYVLGIFILAFLGVHLFDFWYKMQFSELFHLDSAVEADQVGVLMNELFAHPVRVGLYLIGIIALWFHLTHGFWSMFQTVGINNRTWLPRVKCVGNIIATLICLGFASVPIFFFTKSILCGA